MRPVASSTSTRAPASAPSADRARVSSRTRAPRASTSVDAVDAGRVERALDQHGVLGQARRRAGGSTPAARARSTTSQRASTVERVRGLVRRRGEQRAAADLDAAVAQRPRSPRSAAASGRAARRPRGRRPPAPVGRARRRARAPRPAPASPTLPPNAPPLASGVAGSPTRRGTPAGVGFEVRGLDPARRERAPRRRARRAARAAARRPPSCAGPAPCRPARGPSASDSPTHPVEPGGARPSRPRSRPGTGPRRARRRRAWSSANPASPVGTAGPTRCAAPPSSSARRPAASRSRATSVRLCALSALRDAEVGRSRKRRGEVEGLVDGLPAGAAAEVRGEGAVDVGAARSGPSRRARRGAR